MDSKLKGFITFFVNYHTDMAQSAEEIVVLHKNLNKDVVEALQKSGYEVMFVACTKEACRVEKVDFDQPFPRFVPGKTRMIENAKPKEEV